MNIHIYIYIYRHSHGAVGGGCSGLGSCYIESIVDRHSHGAIGVVHGLADEGLRGVRK